MLFSTILASSMAFIDTSALNVALPALQDDLQASGVQLLWIVNAYLLMLAALILVGGSLGDKLGRKKVLMTGVSLFVLASLACGLAPTTEFLIGARVVQGIGGAMMIPGSLAIITASFDPNRRGQAIGTWAAATTIVTIAGPVLGGFLAEAGAWRLPDQPTAGNYHAADTLLQSPRESRGGLQTDRLPRCGPSNARTGRSNVWFHLSA